MRERRRTAIAAVALLVALAWLDRAAPLVTVAGTLDARAPATAQAAVDLGVLGTVGLTWTLNRLR